MKHTERWYSERTGMEMSLVRWGTHGVPVLLFPTAGGDAEEAERRDLISACGDLLGQGRIKIYAVDSVAGRAMVERWGHAQQRLRLLDAFHKYVRHEVVPAIHADCHGPHEIIAAGASIGAFNALAVTCRWPEVFRAAVCMSGTYDIDKHYEGEWSEELFYASPLQFLPGLEGRQLEKLRERFILLASGRGEWEDITESWRLADLLGSKGIPNQVVPWGTEWSHDWGTWLAMLPVYLDELT